MSTTDVTVVMGCFNEQPDRLATAVESALAQRGCAVELIVTDDGSTDPATVAALAALPPQVQVLRQDNRGLPAARNAAIAAGSGRFILPLDSDDWLGPDTAARASAALDARADAVIAYTRIIYVSPDRVERPAPEQVREYRVEDLALGNTIPVASMFRRADWLRLGGYDESLAEVGHEDYEWWVRLLADGAVAVPAAGADFYYRVRPDSMSARMRRQGTSMAVTRAAMLRNSPGVAPKLLDGLWATNEALLRERQSLLMERTALRAQLQQLAEAPPPAPSPSA